MLGFGTIWNGLNLLNGLSYTGANALAEYRALTGNPAAAEELNCSEYTLRGAVNRGEVKTVPFNGLHRIPPLELERIRGIFRL